MDIKIEIKHKSKKKSLSIKFDENNINDVMRTIKKEIFEISDRNSDFLFHINGKDVFYLEGINFSKNDEYISTSHNDRIFLRYILKNKGIFKKTEEIQEQFYKGNKHLVANMFMKFKRLGMNVETKWNIGRRIVDTYEKR